MGIMARLSPILDTDDSRFVSRPKEAPTGPQRPPPGKVDVPLDGTIRLVGHCVREVQHGMVQVEVQITCEGRTFNGTAAGSEAPRDRLRVPALATLRALDACVQVFHLGVSKPALVLDRVVEVSVGDFPVAVVMITASESAKSLPLVAACPLVGMSDLAIILAVLEATGRTVTHWLTWGDRTSSVEQQDRPQ